MKNSRGFFSNYEDLGDYLATRPKIRDILVRQRDSYLELLIGENYEFRTIVFRTELRNDDFIQPSKLNDLLISQKVGFDVENATETEDPYDDESIRWYVPRKWNWKPVK